MPGVPSGRGCDACRRQKKKCDQAHPTCSRCTRLRIPCEGAGVQRYQFKLEDPKAKSQSLNKDNIITIVERRSPFTSIPTSPQHELVPLIDAFVDKITPTTNLCHNLAWTYGTFLDDVPKRLGANRALDAATEALVASHHCITSVNIDTRASALAAYSKGLKALKACLDDPSQAQTPETLGSVMILLICQSFLGGGGSYWTGHCEGAAQMLRARGFCEPQNPFEAKLLLTLRGPILFEAIFNPDIQLSASEWLDLVYNKLDGSTLEGRLLLFFARAPDIMRQGNEALATEVNHIIVYQEALCCYIATKDILTCLRDRYATIEHKVLEDPILLTDATNLKSRLYAHYQRMYGLGLMIVLVFGCIVAALEEKQSTITEEVLQFSKDAIELAYQASSFRPLGAQYMILCLTIAWIGAGDDSETRDEVQRLLLDFSKDFPYWNTESEFSETRLGQVRQRLRLRNR